MGTPQNKNVIICAHILLWFTSPYQSPDTTRITMNLLPLVIHPVMPVWDFTVLGKTFDLNVEMPFVTISQADHDKNLSSSTPGPIPSKKRKFDGNNANLV